MIAWRPAFVAVALPSLINLAIVAHGYDGGPYLRGDCPYYYATAVSLWRDHDLDLANQLTGPIASHADSVAIAQDGRVVPKHPILMAIVSSPFIAVFGPRGALAFNLLQFAAALALIFALASEAASPMAAAAATVLVYAGSFLPDYAWNFSPDLFAAVLVVGAAVAARRATRGPGVAFLTGLLAGAAVAAKQPLALLVPATFMLLRPLDRRTIFAALAGLAVPIAALAILDTHLFGRPWLTGYDSILVLRPDGVPAVYSQRSTFGGAVLAGLRGQLIDPRHGLLTTSPILVVAWAGWPILSRRSRVLAAYAAGSSVALFLFYGFYDFWSASHYGNRFLMVDVMLAALPLAALADVLGPLLRTHLKIPGLPERTSLRNPAEH